MVGLDLLCDDVDGFGEEEFVLYCELMGWCCLCGGVLLPVDVGLVFVECLCVLCESLFLECYYPALSKDVGYGSDEQDGAGGNDVEEGAADCTVFLLQQVVAHVGVIFGLCILEGFEVE